MKSQTGKWFRTNQKNASLNIQSGGLQPALPGNCTNNLTYLQTRSCLFRKSSQKGIGLIEVLVALLILSFSVTGLIVTQSKSSLLVSESMARSGAMAILAGVSDIMTLQRASLPLEDFSIEINASTGQQSGILQTQLYHAWRLLDEKLPSPVLTIDCVSNTYRNCVLCVTWRSSSASLPSSAPHCLESSIV